MSSSVNISVINKRSVLSYALSYLNFLVLLLVSLFAYLNLNNFSFIENWTFNISMLALTLFLFHIIQLKILKFAYYDFRVWFTLLMYLFFFGRVFLEGFNLSGEIFWDLMSRYSDKTMSNASLYIICYTQSIFWGLTNFVTKSDYKGLEKKTLTNRIIGWNSKEEVNNLLFKSGLLLVIFSAPFKFFVDIQDIVAAQSSGMYYALTEKSGLADDFAFLFVPGIIALIVSGNEYKNKKMVGLVALSISYFLITMILTGDRRYAVTSILAIILSFMMINKVKINYLKLLFLTLGVLFFLNLLSEIRKIRLNGLSDIFSFFAQGNFNIFSSQILYEVFAEFGLSFFSVVAVYKEIPQNIDYLYGLSFIGSLVSLLPIGFLFLDFFSMVSISKQVNALPGNYSVGATLAGDFYANFGWLSILIVILFGYVLSKIFSFKNDFSENYYIWRYFSLFYILINLIRSSFFEIVRPTFLIIIIPIIFIKILKNMKE